MKINVTKTFLPPHKDYQKILESVWKIGWITNRGPLVDKLESELMQYLSISNILITANGTLPLQIALKTLGSEGEIITTPFSYVATTAAIVWEKCKPVFVDIDPYHLTIDESLIEASITSQTTAILATHVFGNPCNVKIIDDIAAKYGLKIIYDAAHAFGVKYNKKSIFEYGDVSTCSFHATKLFHTGEGGAIVANKKKLRDQLFRVHNFGHNGPLDFYGLGINAKISELQSAMGLALLPYMDIILEGRKNVVDYYSKHLNFNNITPLKLRNKTEWNYSYYPIIFQNEKLLLEVQKELNKNDIFPRRYFYPSLNKLNYVKYIPMPISESISSRILCLPLYVGLSEKILYKIVKIINLKTC